MRAYPECGLCMLTWVYERVSNTLGDEERFEILGRLMAVAAKELSPSVGLGSFCNRSLDAVKEFQMASSGFYGPLKQKNNEAAQRLLDRARTFIQNAQTPRQQWERACALAAVSNVAPIGFPSVPFEFTLVEDMIEGRAPLPQSWGDPYAAVSRAGKVLYVADNAGEIGFDALTISLLKEWGAMVNLLVKEGPFFDDATLEDARFFGLQHLADGVHCVQGGIFVPEETDPELARLFEESDFIVSKGTGNFEVLKDHPGAKKTLFLLKSKCEPVARETSVPIGAFVIQVEG